MNENKTKCFFCKSESTQTITLGKSTKLTKVCDTCKNSFENNNWVSSGILDMKEKGVNPNNFHGLRKNKR